MRPEALGPPVEGPGGCEQHVEVRTASVDEERERLPVHARRDGNQYSHEARVRFRGQRPHESRHAEIVHSLVALPAYTRCALPQGLPRRNVSKGTCCLAQTAPPEGVPRVTGHPSTRE